MQQTRRVLAAVRRLPARVLVAWAALAGGVVALAAHAPVLVHRCLPADGLTGAAPGRRPSSSSAPSSHRPDAELAVR